MIEKIYVAYTPKHDITFILKDIIVNENEIISTEVIGFVHGNEEDNEKILHQYIGKLKAEYTL